MPPNKHYKAFISYSHKDAKWAKWLHRALERYVVPLDAYPPREQLEKDGSKRSRRLTPVFRDRDEMPASGSLADTIREALESSENLIVLCSPNSVGSQYVNAEIEMFRDLHPDNKQKIYALIIEGEPPDCFPAALTAEGAEPIAADAREEGDGKSDSKLKLIAGMLGVRFDRLKRREAKRQRNRMLATVTVISVVAVITSASTLWALKAEREATKQKELAVEQRALAEQRQTEAEKAREATEVALAKAEQSAKESKAVLGFFTSKVLSVARPDYEAGGLGVNVTVRDAIEAVEPQIGEAFGDQPLIEASIRSSLVWIYSSNGQRNSMLLQRKRILELTKKTLGPEHLDTIHAMDNAASSYSSMRRHKEALALRKKALELRKKLLGLEHRNTIFSIITLAGAYSVSGRYEEALPLYKKALELRKKLLGPEHLDTISLISSIAGLHRRAGRNEKSLPLYEKVLEWRIKTLGPEHRDTFSSMENLASLYLLVHRKDEALALREKLLKLKKNALGPEHIFSTGTMHNLADSYSSVGRIKEALALHKEALKLQQKIWGLENAGSLYWMNQVAIFYSSVGHHEEAVVLHERTLELRKKVLTPGHYQTVQSIYSMANAYSKTGRFEDAASQYRNYIAIREKEEPKNYMLFSAKSLLGKMLTEQNKYVEAEPLLLAGQKGLETTAPNPGWVKYSMLRLITLYIDWDKPDKAAEWQAKLDAFGKSKK